MKTTQRQSAWSPCRGAGATQRKNWHGGFGLQVLVAVLMLLVGGGNSGVGAIVHYRSDDPRC